MRIAERENHLLALHLGAVADADDVELALEAVGDAGHRVGDQAARQAMKLASAGIVGRPLGDEMAVGQLEVDAARERLFQLALRPLDFDGASSTLTVTPLGIAMGFFPIRDISVILVGFGLEAALAQGFGPSLSQPASPYQMLQSTSPPTPAFTASRPVITPRDVVRMLVPSPASTSGTSSRPK